MLLFCLEYGIDPYTPASLNYQRDEIRVYEPFPERIVDIMNKIIDLIND